MKGLSCKCDDPKLSKRIKIKFFGGILAGAVLAYTAILIAAVIAKEVLK